MGQGTSRSQPPAGRLPSRQTTEQAVWSDSGGNAWAVGVVLGDSSGPLFRHDGSAWSEVGLADVPLAAIAGSSACDLWAVGESGTVVRREPL